MDYINDLFNKANRIFGAIALVFVALLVINTLIFSLIPIIYFKIIGAIILGLAIIDYGSYMWLEHYEDYVYMSNSPKDYLWNFRDFLDDYTGKTFRDYARSCENYNVFEDSMEKFSQLFDSESKDNFGKTLLHFKHMYEATSDVDKINRIKHEANQFLNHKYNQLANFEKSHNHQKLWSNAEKHGFNNLPKVLNDEGVAMHNLMND